jgi:hypothetical protein
MKKNTTLRKPGALLSLSSSSGVLVTSRAIYPKPTQGSGSVPIAFE